MAAARRRDRAQVGPTNSAAQEHDGGELGSNVVVDAASARVVCELPIEGARGWYVSALFLPEGDRLVMAELKVFPGPSDPERRRAARRRPGEWSGRPDALQGVPDGGVSARLLRCIRLSDLQQLLVDALPDAPTSLEPTAFPRSGAVGSHAGRSDRYYAEWAFAYAKKLAEGSRSPIKDLAAEHGRSPAQVRDLIHDARVRGMLSKERQGRAAGSLTPQAIELLRDHSQRRPGRTA